jgi:ATP-dependent Clp protease ATP-binding subunit ClpA
VDSRFSDATRSVVAHAEEEAHRLGSALVGTEHLLLGLLSDRRNRAAQVLLDAGATLDGCRSKVVELVGPPVGSPAGTELPLTDRARRSLQRADRLSLRLRAARVEPEHVLVSLLDVEGRAGQVLRGLGVDVALLRDAAASEGTVGSDPTGPVGVASSSSPRCRDCGSDLSSGGLAHSVVPSQTGDGRVGQFVVVYCAACGTALGATLVPPG